MDDDEYEWNAESRPPIPNGSIVRTSWPDEELSQCTEYDAQANDGWISPGVVALKHQDMERYMEHGIKLEALGESLVVPHNEKGLMIADCAWFFVSDNSPIDVETDDEYTREVWYRVLWGERSVWINSQHIVLVKKCTLDPPQRYRTGKSWHTDNH